MISAVFRSTPQQIEVLSPEDEIHFVADGDQSTPPQHDHAEISWGRKHPRGMVILHIHNGAWINCLGGCCDAGDLFDAGQ